VPALTTQQLETTHKKYLDASNASPSDFWEALNEIMPRIYKMGYWREMLLEHSQSAKDEYISLPPETDSLVAGILDNSPLPTRSLWHDYKIFGTNDRDDTLLSSFIDDGYAPTYRDLVSGSQYIIKYSSLKGPFNKRPELGKINIKYRQHSDATNHHGVVHPETKLELSSYSEVTYNFARSYSSGDAAGFELALVADTDVTDIVSITWSDMESDHPIIVVAEYQGVAGESITTDSTKDLMLAEINSRNGVSRYRRFRVGGTNNTSTAHLLLKRRWIDCDSAHDLIHIPSNAIIKHALLGKLGEDNGDAQRAEYHWGLVAQLLESDTDSYRGSAKPALNISPNGVGGGMLGMY